jgi:hypothetical protein
MHKALVIDGGFVVMQPIIIRIEGQAAPEFA